MTDVIRILGIDPGLRRTGWGVLERAGTRLSYVACGTAGAPERAPMAERLAAIFRKLSDVVAEFAPDEAAVEQTFVNRNAASALVLGLGGGAALRARATAGVPVSEYAPNAVKKAVVGAGHADKTQVQLMIRVLLPGAKAAGPEMGADAADALAVAVCHAHAAAGRALRGVA